MTILNRLREYPLSVLAAYAFIYGVGGAVSLVVLAILVYMAWSFVVLRFALGIVFLVFGFKLSVERLDRWERYKRRQGRG